MLALIYCLIVLIFGLGFSLVWLVGLLTLEAIIYLIIGITILLINATNKEAFNLFKDKE